MNSKHANSFARLPTILLSILVVTAYGCGGGVEGPIGATVSGTVRFNGEPLREGVIRFVPEGDTAGPQTTIPVTDGQFAVEDVSVGPIVGSHRIEIQSTEDGGYAMDDENAIQKLRESGIKKIEVVTIPAMFNTQSTLHEVVTETGPNEFTFDLKPSRRR